MEQSPPRSRRASWRRSGCSRSGITCRALQHPYGIARAARYLKGTSTTTAYDVARPWGNVRRFRLFDQEFIAPQGAASSLVGQDHRTHSIERWPTSCAGRINKLIHARAQWQRKGTFAACVMRALEHYSSTDEGALYRFCGSFAHPGGPRDRVWRASRCRAQSYAHLEEDRSPPSSRRAARAPVAALPIDQRRELLTVRTPPPGVGQEPPSWLWSGRLGRKRGRLDALLAARGRSAARAVHVRSSTTTSRGAIGPGRGDRPSDDRRRVERRDHGGPQPPPCPSRSRRSRCTRRGELVDGQGGVIEGTTISSSALDAWNIC
jgi:hypothetical protein